MEVAVAEVARFLDRQAPVQAAAVEAVDFARLQVGVVAQSALAVFQAFRVQLDEPAAHAAGFRVLRQEGQRLFEEALDHAHVAVQDVDVFAAGVLPAQLRRRAAAALGGIGELHDAHRIPARELHGAVARAAVGQDDLAADARHGSQAALDGGADVLLLVQRLDDDGDGAFHGSVPCCAKASAARSRQRCQRPASCAGASSMRKVICQRRPVSKPHRPCAADCSVMHR